MFETMNADVFSQNQRFDMHRHYIAGLEWMNKRPIKERVRNIPIKKD